MKPIDGEELKKHIENTICYGCETGHMIPPCGRCYVSTVLMYIDDMPEVDAQLVKHGRWIIDYAEGTKIYHAHCSECGKEPDRNIGGDYYIDKLSDFCPNCCAKMDGDSE